MMKNFIVTSIGKKVAMAISAIFLMIFLLQHFLINITSVFSEDIFNMLSHFMGTNFLVQFILQPVLIFGVMATFGAVVDGAPFKAPLLLLAALTLFFAVLGPLAAGYALKNAGD